MSASFAEVLQRAGVSGAGGAGFPAYAKYREPLPLHVTNAQESEPGYVTDKWIHRRFVAEFVDLYARLRAWGVKKTVVAAKMKDRPWLAPLEEATRGAVLDCTGKSRHALDAVATDVIFTYTDDRYAFGMETALLNVCAGKKIPQGERPSDHGVIVSNTETLLNLWRALTSGAPVTEKYVHVYGETPRHTFLLAPVGTPAAAVLEDAGLPLAEIAARGLVVADGGPGWFDLVDPASAVVTRRTNSLLVIDPSYADPTQKDVLPKGAKPGYPRTPPASWEQEPRAFAAREVRVPLGDSSKLRSVRAAVPCVAAGERVARGQAVARASEEGLSIDAHASIDGVVREVDAAAGFVRIEAAS